MKKTSILALALISAIALTSCSKKEGDSKSTSAKAVSPSSIPASGAKKFIKDDSYIISAAKSIQKEGDSFIDFLMDDFQNLFSGIQKQTNAYLASYSGRDSYADALEKSRYVQNLAKEFEKLQESLQEEFRVLMKDGKADFSWSIEPGKAKDLPKGMMLNIPALSLKAKVNQDPKAIKGSASASGKGSLYIDIDGLSYSIENLSFDADVKVNENAEVAFDGSAKGKVNFSLDPKKFDIEDSSIKYFCINAGTSLEAKGKSNFNVRDIIAKKASLDFSTNSGLSFAAPNGVGGKAILAFNTEVNLADIDLASKEEEFYELAEKFYTGEELSEKEINSLFKGIKVSLSLKFYDDDNKETYAFIDAKNAYELYKTFVDFNDKYGFADSFDFDNDDYDLDSYMDDVNSYMDTYSDELNSYMDDLNSYAEELNSYASDYDFDW